MSSALSVSGVSKKYQLGKVAATSISDMVKGLFSGNRDSVENEFWALDDVSFDLERGEVLGIIGKNGAGKSTLLKVLSRITVPTKGQVRLNGRVASLLEVGTGFHPELTGLENIYLNGSILGMNRSEIKSKIDEIIEFSGVQKFISTPVKHYSSGMYVRLAFAVAAHLEPEILIVDEVLAVGDAEFQKKCLGKMKNVAGSGRTVLFVSHNMSAVKSLCSRALLLDKGRVSLSGTVDQVLSEYLKLTSASNSSTWESSDQKSVLRGATLLNAHSLKTSDFLNSEEIRIELKLLMNDWPKSRRLVVDLVDSVGRVIFRSGHNDANDGLTNEFIGSNGERIVGVQIPALLLNQGEFSVDVRIGDFSFKEWLEVHEGILSFGVEFNLPNKSLNQLKSKGIVAPILNWSIKQ